MDYELRKLIFLPFLLLCLLIPGNALSEEVLTFQEAFPDYEKVWEIPKSQLPDTAVTAVYTGDGYFGIRMGHLGNFSYAHFDRSGKMLWNTKNFDYDIRWISVSPTGNRVIMQHGKHSMVAEVYNDFGNHLHSFRVGEAILMSSPNGNFFYSRSWEEWPVPFILLTENGDTVYSCSSGKWRLAEALDDSTLVFYDRQALSIINVNTGEFLHKKSNEEFISSPGIEYLTVSRSPKKILCWNRSEAVLMDKSLNWLTKIESHARIRDAAYLSDYPEFLYIRTWIEAGQTAFVRNNTLLYARNGDLVDEMEIILEPNSGISRTTRCTKNKVIYEYTYLIDPDARPTVRQQQSYIVSFDPELPEVMSGNVIVNQSFPLCGSSDILEIGETCINYWTKKGGE
ncbi:MAG: hypothetical protein GF315_01750 [candidate division Zixibacteria bacterium]|nr:hypothetical protein [candidate division Zixibacteria bacterium]